MSSPDPFEVHTDRYERWFERHEPVYRSDLDALSSFIDDPGFALGVVRRAQS